MTRRGDFIQIGERLRLTRQALGMTQAAFAKHVGIARNTFNQYETGVNQLSIENAHALCDAYKLTFDWLYRGDVGQLPHTLATAIEALRKARGELP
jgi:transcriptional regulator with XRE-family HTH domain